MAVAAVALLVVNAPVGHRFADLDYGTPLPLEDYGPTASGGGLLASSEVLPAWAAQQAARGGGEDPSPLPPLVVVAVDGGGLRAALWTVSVLTRIEEDLPRLPYATRLVTGASGGMVGAAFYVASLAPPASGGGVLHSDARAPLGREEMLQRIGTESLEAVARTLVFGDFLPPVFHPADDRGYALERRWEENTGVLQVPLASLRPGEEEGWRPSLVFAPMLVEDGRRLFVSNLDLADLASLRLPLAPGTADTLQALEFFKLFPGETDLRLSAAARMSAAFPYVTPAAEIPTDPSYRLVDAGYYDSHGVELAASWIHLNRGWLIENTGGVALVQIPDERTLRARQRAHSRHRSLWARGLSAWSSPIEGVFAGRSASMAFRNDSLVRMVSLDLNAERAGFFETFVFEPAPREGEPEETGQDVALSWRLTSVERRRLEEGPDAEPNVEQRRQLVAWWAEHGGR